MTIKQSLSVETLGRITVLQSMVTLLPNKISMLDFVCQGLKDVTGVKSLAYRLFDGSTAPPINPVRSAEMMQVFPIKFNAMTYAELNFEIAESEAFDRYIPFLQNFANMLGVVFEGQTQRKLNETLLEELEQRVAERTSELQEKTEDLRITLNSISDAVISTDVYGNVTNMNPVAEKLTGWKVVDGIGRNLTDVFQIVNVATLQPALNPVKRVLATGEIVGLATHTALIAKDGTRYQIADSAAPIRDINGNICGVVLVFRDVSDEYRIAEALKASEERYRELVDLAVDGILQGSADGKIIGANSQMQKWLDRPLEHLLGLHVSELFDPEELKAKPLRFDLLNLKQLLVNERNLRRPDGTSLPVEMHSKRMPDGNYQSICRDITERKQVEEEKARFEKLNKQLQKFSSLDRMAGSIAHTFNNQLGVVIGNLELAILDLPRDTKPITQLAAAMQGARKAAEVSGQLLTYLGQTPGLHVPLDLAESCRQCLPLLQAGDSHGLILTFNLPSPGPTISANANQIQQVLTNLVTNAREAIGEKERAVHLIVKTVSHTDIPTAHLFPVDWTPMDLDYSCIEVRDTGCGIANENIDKLFDPFYTTKFTGRGLGLPVVLGIIRAHNGVVTVASEPGRGTIVRIFFPVSMAEIPRQQVQSAQPLAVEESGTALLVEDEELVREMAATMLTRMGYKVYTAKDGVEALEVFKNHLDEIHAVLSDLSMPRMNGWETLAALRKISPGIPVILCSGYDEAQVLTGDHPERPQAFLHKPYQMVELQAALAKAMEG